ncbi:MAG TPA: hypothetical protein VFB84_04170 [Micromonosporaceae bacterium]|nr:hypothetical protein [Micromonosporaceae bacterium]
MASYGPPGGPYPGQPPGQPAEPWRDGQAPEYGEPTDPWGGETSAVPPDYDYGYGHSDAAYDHGHGDRGYGPGDPYPVSPGRGGPEHATEPYAETPGYGDREYGAAPPTGPVWQSAHAPGADPAGRGRPTGLMLLVVAVVVLLLGGGGLGGYLIYRATDDTTGSGSGASPGPSKVPATATSQAPASPTAPAASGDSRFVTKGQCVVNDGTSDKPAMRVVPCGPNTYEVLARFDGTVKHQEKCPGVAGYEYHYYYDSELDVLDFVLCLKKRR